MHLIRLIDAYQPTSSWAETTIAKKCAGQAHFFTRLRDDANITVDRYNRVLTWFSDHWPTDLPWPPDVPRPVSLPPSAGPAADGAPGEGAVPEYGELPKSLAAWCRKHDFDERQARKVLELYADAGRLAGRKPRRETCFRRGGQTYRFKSERYMIWQQFVEDRDPRFKQAIMFSDMAGLINPGGQAA